MSEVEGSLEIISSGDPTERTHGGSSAIRRLYKCGYCALTVADIKKLKEHMVNIHLPASTTEKSDTVVTELVEEEEFQEIEGNEGMCPVCVSCLCIVSEKLSTHTSKIQNPYLQNPVPIPPKPSTHTSETEYTYLRNPVPILLKLSTPASEIQCR